ncbi:MAG: molybdopterin molybdenumtransferase MoeA, partial [Acidimicrobiia bacterium]|nr:molybdopterin molybdenumtransferase MoeA [Acidimicrobiia bacterium]
MRPLEEPVAALARLLDLLKPVSTEHVDLADAFGRVLGHEVVADRPSPSVAVTAMDGFAVRLADLPGVLPVAGEVAIGQQPPELPTGATVRIFTG